MLGWGWQHWSKVTGLSDGCVGPAEYGDRNESHGRILAAICLGCFGERQRREGRSPPPPPGYAREYSLPLLLSNRWVYMCIHGAQVWLCTACVVQDPSVVCMPTGHVREVQDSPHPRVAGRLRSGVGGAEMSRVFKRSYCRWMIISADQQRILRLEFC